MQRAVCVVFSVLASATIRAQAPPTFEVASVKQNDSGETRTYYRVPPTGLVSLTNATVRALIREAYEIDPSFERFLLVTPSNHSVVAESPMTGPRFDVTARPPDDAPSGQQHAMLRTLLGERFKLRVHTETRDIPVYALTIAREDRLGPNLRSIEGRLHGLHD